MQRLARAHSLEAVQALIGLLHDPDGRIVAVAASSLLERALCKTKEMKPEDNEQVRIDLTALSESELQILVNLVASGRLRGVPSEEPDQAAPVMIEAEPADAK
jgi:hypothetical protein